MIRMAADGAASEGGCDRMSTTASETGRTPKIGRSASTRLNGARPWGPRQLVTFAIALIALIATALVAVPQAGAQAGDVPDDVYEQIEAGCPDPDLVFTVPDDPSRLDCAISVAAVDDCPADAESDLFDGQVICFVGLSDRLRAPVGTVLPPMFSESDCDGFMNEGGWVGGPVDDGMCYVELEDGSFATEPIVSSTDTTCGGLPVTVDIGAGDEPTAGNDVILGTLGDDAIGGGDGDDVICGRGGNDSLWGQGGNDWIVGEGGDDKIRGGDGNDVLLGGPGGDDLGGGRGDDYVAGESGADTKVRGGTGDDLVAGDQGDDELVAGNGGEDEVYGGAGNDMLVSGGPRPDVLEGQTGNDVVKGLGGADMIYGGGGDDELFGGKQPDFLNGGFGTDICNGGSEGDQAVNCESTVGVEDEIAPAAGNSRSRRAFGKPAPRLTV